MIRILNIEPKGYSPQAREIFDTVGEVVEAPLSRSDLIEKIGDYDALIVRLAHRIDRDVLGAAGSRLKAVVSATTGLDHIDLESAREFGIRVISLKGEIDFLKTVSATAEHAWALLLALIRKLPQAFASVREGQWDRDRFRGSELYEKHLGIVGLGRLGCKIAKYGMAFGMEVSAYDPHASEWVDGVTRVGRLEDLLKTADVVSLHVPLSPETEKMIDANALSFMRPEAVLINTSRGRIVDETALTDALATGKIAGAALDVICNERREALRRSASNRLLAYAGQKDNLIITPHIAGATHESMARTEIFVARKLASFFGPNVKPDRL